MTRPAIRKSVRDVTPSFRTAFLSRLDEASVEQRAYLCVYALTNGLIRPHCLSMWVVLLICRVLDLKHRGFVPLAILLKHQDNARLRYQIWNQLVDRIGAPSGTAGWSRVDWHRFIAFCGREGITLGVTAGE